MLNFQPPEDLDLALVVKFFWLFSSMESVLKRKGFVKSDRYQNAIPDWIKFENEIDADLSRVTEQGFLRAVAYLVKHPPMRQKLDGSTVRWEAQEKQSFTTDAKFAISMARSVRNNLFHGGKYPERQVEGTERNKILIESALIVLSKCVELRRKMFEFLPYVV